MLARFVCPLGRGLPLHQPMYYGFALSYLGMSYTVTDGRAGRCYCGSHSIRFLRVGGIREEDGWEDGK